MQLADYERKNAELDEEMKAKNAQPEAETATPVAEEVAETPEQEAEETTVEKTRYDEAVKRMNAAMQEAAQLRKENESLKAAKAPDKESSPEVETTATTPDEEESDAEMEFREDFPEFAAVIDQKMEKLKESFDKKLSDIESSHNNLSSHFDKRYWNEINRAHPDLEEIKSNPDFPAWKAEQDQSTLDKLHSGDHADVIDALKKFKTDKGMTGNEAEKPPVKATVIDINVAPESKMEKAKKMAAPTVPPSTGGKTEKAFKVLSPEERSGLSMKELEAYNEAWDREMMKGNK